MDRGEIPLSGSWHLIAYIHSDHSFLPRSPSMVLQKDKYENEELIRFGLPEDVWFHVDDLSSAHVYLRQKPGEKLDDISPDLLLECASLVKVCSQSIHA